MGLIGNPKPSTAEEKIEEFLKIYEKELESRSAEEVRKRKDIEEKERKEKNFKAFLDGKFEQIIKDGIENVNARLRPRQRQNS